MEKFNLKFGKCAQVFPGLSSLTTRFISGVSLLLLPNSISQCQDLDFPWKIQINEDIPNEIIKLFPCINPFIEDKEIYNFHYINSSVGLEGIVITKK